MKRHGLLGLLLLAGWMVLLGACGAENATPTGGDGDTAESNEAEPDGPPLCGDGRCQSPENTLLCPTDCAPRCGDGLCTFGEFCANCPSDCDCSTLAATPPMGWNSWNKFACAIDQTLLADMARTFVDSGMKSSGYRYFNLDDCWQESRDATGRVQVHPTRFSQGMPALVTKIHELGLLFGLYSCAGNKTCQEKPGSYGYEEIDAQTYAAWQVDYLKHDWCFTDEPKLVPVERYRVMHEALAKQSRPILLSICEWGRDAPWIWGPQFGQVWRSTGDIANLFASVQLNFKQTAALAAFAGPGHFNDPDMLEVGNGGLSNEQEITHMSWWAIIAAPLIAGNDLRSMDERVKGILQNPEVIAIDQDPAGVQGVPFPTPDTAVTAYVRPLTETGARAIVISNTNYRAKPYNIDLAILKLQSGELALRDVWAHQDLAPSAGPLSGTLPPGGAVMYIARGKEPPVPGGTTALAAWPFIHIANALGPIETDRSVGAEAAGDGTPLKIAGTSYAKGLGTSAAVLLAHLGGACTRFTANVGIDDAAGPGQGALRFELWGDGRLLAQSPTLSGGTPAFALTADLTGIARLKLVAATAGTTLDGAYADWAEAQIECR